MKIMFLPETAALYELQESSLLRRSGVREQKGPHAPRLFFDGGPMWPATASDRRPAMNS